MTKVPKHRVKFRRRRNGMTDYRKRLRYLSGNEPMFTVRFSNKYATIQVIKYTPAGDVIIYGTTSRILKKYGLNKSYLSLPAIYLTGYFVASKVKKDIKEGILNTGNSNPIKGGRFYAALKGIVDCGVSIPHDKSIYPSEERLNGSHLKEKIDIKGIIKKINEEVKAND